MRPLDSSPLAADAPLPGLPATWQLAVSTPEVVAASRRLLALQQMLGGGESGDASDGSGGGGIDVVWMVVREPALLSADLTQLTSRLLDMKLATMGSGVDVLGLVEAQPALLLSDRWRWDLESLQAPAATPSSAAEPPSSSSAAPTSSGPSLSVLQNPPSAATSRSPEAPSPNNVLPTPAFYTVSAGSAAAASTSGTAASAAASAEGSEPSGAVGELVQAWQHGLASDGDAEWATRLGEMAAYVRAHGDTGVGFREGDDADLARWASKQRADWRKGRLAPGRLEQLSELGFIFDADEAEWVRWFRDLVTFKEATGHASPMPLVTGADMYLINWCSIQRIARRSRVLSESRIKRLDDLGFDWSGADPLS
ncbi:hypothetical protein GPECTOR_5g194 [Gonium pectorale]|uniref:Helicase-associated domain-containing protein n=1 Tax=Gonium pectorale TaxID=33097 RepID=A0A150GWB5_GONPE|nr:hypothetical protein GPECTOR_5g194 [Gonium pectorale]|eukprot:KXZ54089.1 hypothetical protein GPECTOR_5g194 [Gonium pectorale]